MSFRSRGEVKESTVRSFLNCKELVREVLRVSVRSRNDDKWLIIKCLEFQGVDIEVIDKESGLIGLCFTVKEWCKTFSFETLTRCRRELQNKDGVFLPTDPHVIHERRIREEVVRQYYAVGDKEILDSWEVLRRGKC